jgi:GNAT superfamily N-acetyltransferase
MTFSIRPCTREQFISAISNDPADKFAKTFVAKADMQGQWDWCLGAFTEDGELAGAVIMTISKRLPYVANLQLLHTFAAHRRKGAARLLMNVMLHQAHETCDYFRVSSEPSAVAFYESIGLKFWGKQKSGCQLCIFRFDNEGKHRYILNEPVIHAAVFRKGKGGVVELFEPSISE